jgi:hypothetical protein
MLRVHGAGGEDVILAVVDADGGVVGAGELAREHESLGRRAGLCEGCHGQAGQYGCQSKNSIHLFSYI